MQLTYVDLNKIGPQTAAYYFHNLYCKKNVTINRFWIVTDILDISLLVCGLSNEKYVVSEFKKKKDKVVIEIDAKFHSYKRMLAYFANENGPADHLEDEHTYIGIPDPKFAKLLAN